MTSQSELAYQQIKKMIFHMELLPGDRVSELQIATKLSISRTPIHDALRRLEGEGLLRLERNRGATVICFSEDEVRDWHVAPVSGYIVHAVGILLWLCFRF